MSESESENDGKSKSGKSSGDKRLDEIGERLERVVRGPAAIESQLLFRIARPLFAIAKWRANMQAAALTALVAILRRDGAIAADPKASKAALDTAIDELEANASAIERVAIVRKRVPVAHALWLRRVHAMLVLAHAAIAHAAVAAQKDDAANDDDDDDDVRDEATRAAACTDPSGLLPPLVALRKKATSALEVPLEDDPDAEDARLVDLELAAIDHLMAAARAETLVLGRKRRLLVAARQRLLEASAALPLDRDGVRERTRYLAREITRIDRLEGAGLSTDVSLLYQARQALTRHDPTRLYATLSALDANALSAADRAVSAKTGHALARISEQENRDRQSAYKASLARSVTELLGNDVATKVSDVVEEVRGDAMTRLNNAGISLAERREARELLDYLPADSTTSILNAAVAADGFFEVGGALLPVRLAEERRVLRMVRHPTQDLLLMPAEDVHDLRDAVIGDPRSILLDLATGRLFARRFVKEEVQRRTRVVLRGEVRVYVLDGSGSMKGSRARVRDAILIAELSTLMRRLESPNDTRCTLFYRYFTEDLGPVKKIGTVAEARDAIRDVVTTERYGGTDIQVALLASLQQIAESRAHDPNLARAQIVLVTDGESSVDEPTIVSAREAMAGLPIGVSVIALGQENPALRGLVSRQRAKGEAAFYHFIDDAELVSITTGLTGSSDDMVLSAIHPPDRWTELEKNPKKLARALDDEVGGLLEELEEIDRQRDHGALERLEEEAQARREVGLSEEEEGVGDGKRARMEALRKDRVALGARYTRWFPEPATQPFPQQQPTELPALPAPGTHERDDIDATCCALASVAEVVTLLGGSTFARQADAIDLLERLLPDARLSHGRYRAVVRDFPHAIAPSLRALRDAVAGPPAGSAGSPTKID